jgi:hypothetical protein
MEDRILLYVAAKELSLEEIEQVNGGGKTANLSGGQLTSQRSGPDGSYDSDRGPFDF